MTEQQKIQVLLSEKDVRIIGPGGWMTAFSGSPTDCKHMANAFAHVLGVKVDASNGVGDHD